MITTKRRSPTSANIQRTAISKASQALQQLPEKPRDTWSLREAVEFLQDTITTALAKGYSYDEVAVMLNEKGVQINAPSLKYYLGRIRKEQQSSASPDQPKVRKPRKSKENAIASPQETDLEDEVNSTGSGRKTSASRKRGVEEVMSYLLDESTDQSSAATEEDETDSVETTEPSTPTKRRTTRTTTRSSTKSSTGAKPRTTSRTKTTKPAPTSRRKKQ